MAQSDIHEYLAGVRYEHGITLLSAKEICEALSTRTDKTSRQLKQLCKYKLIDVQIGNCILSKSSQRPIKLFKINSSIYQKHFKDKGLSLKNK